MITSTGADIATSHLPALSDSSDGVTFTLLGASIRLIARATDTDGRFCCVRADDALGLGAAVPRARERRRDHLRA